MSPDQTGNYLIISKTVAYPVMPLFQNQSCS
jgi:hypothetical protein